MSRAHDRFEALAGALALGEASPAERAEFAQHARTCAPCALDAEALPLVVALVAEAREGERWQPHLGGALDERLRSRREVRSRRTFATLGFGIVASLALNVLFVSGVAGRALDALRVTPDTSPVAATPLTLDVRSHAAAAVVAPKSLRSTAFAPKAPSRTMPSVVRAPASGPRRIARQIRVAAPRAPEVVAGLALAAADVAGLTPEERCAVASESLDAAPAPCPATPANALSR